VRGREKKEGNNYCVVAIGERKREERRKQLLCMRVALEDLVGQHNLMVFFHGSR